MDHNTHTHQFGRSPPSTHVIHRGFKARSLCKVKANVRESFLYLSGNLPASLLFGANTSPHSANLVSLVFIHSILFDCSMCFVCSYFWHSTLDQSVFHIQMVPYWFMIHRFVVVTMLQILTHCQMSELALTPCMVWEFLCSPLPFIVN